MSPRAIVVREEPHDGPTKRTVYHPHADGFEVERQLWRASLGRWWTTDTELLADVTVSVPEGER